MSFETRDQDGKKIKIEELNEEVSDFWGMPIVQYTELKETYMTVFPRNRPENDSSNWVNTIGECISHPCLTREQKIMQQDWKLVKHSMFNVLAQEWNSYQYEHVVVDIVESITYLKPFFELIDLWESKGYIPVRIP